MLLVAGCSAGGGGGSASDAPMSDEQISKAPGIVHVPTCLGAVVLAYNIEGVSTGLKLTPDTVAGYDYPSGIAENPRCFSAREN